MNTEALGYETRPVRMIVACANANGCPAFFATTVQTNAYKMHEGEHYSDARLAAREAGYETVDAVCFDENDGPAWLFQQLFQQVHEVPVEVVQLVDEINGSFEADHGGSVLQVNPDGTISTALWSIWGPEDGPLTRDLVEHELLRAADGIVQILGHPDGD